MQRRSTNCDSNVSSIRALFGLMSNPLWLKILSDGAEVAGGENIFSNSEGFQFLSHYLFHEFKNKKNYIYLTATS